MTYSYKCPQTLKKKLSQKGQHQSNYNVASDGLLWLTSSRKPGGMILLYIASIGAKDTILLVSKSCTISKFPLENSVSSVHCGGPQVVLCVLHCTDVVCPSPVVVTPAPCCDSVVDQLCPLHCGAGGPPPADVGQPSSIEAGCTSWTRRTAALLWKWLLRANNISLVSTFWTLKLLSCLLLYWEHNCAPPPCNCLGFVYSYIAHGQFGFALGQCRINY